MEWQFFTSASKLPSLNFPETSLRTSKSDSGFWIILSAIQSNFLTLEVSIGRNPTPRPPVWGDPSGNQEARSGPGSSSVLHLPQYPDGAPWKWDKTAQHPGRCHEILKMCRDGVSLNFPSLQVTAQLLAGLSLMIFGEKRCEGGDLRWFP